MLIEWQKLRIQQQAVDKWNGVRPTVEAGSGHRPDLFNVSPPSSLIYEIFCGRGRSWLELSRGCAAASNDGSKSRAELGKACPEVSEVTQPLLAVSGARVLRAQAGVPVPPGEFAMSLPPLKLKGALLHRENIIEA